MGPKNDQTFTHACSQRQGLLFNSVKFLKMGSLD